jgi:hypothetical protein
LIQIHLGGVLNSQKELCILLNWKAANSRLKDKACRSLLLKLEKQGLITLPARKSGTNNAKRNASIAYVMHVSLLLACARFCH